MDAMQAAMDADDLTAIHATLMRSVEGYRPELRHLAHRQSGNGSAPVERRNGG